MSKKICICFDYEHDKNYRYLLTALSENPRSDLSFVDLTPSEIDSTDVSKIKAGLTRKINEATHTLVIVGEHANSYHPDKEKIGERNWQWWEIKRSRPQNKLVAVKIAPGNTSPDPLLNAGASWAMTFKVDSIIKAIDEA